MAYYSSMSHLWDDEHFLKLGRLERLIVLYIMHGPSRTNVPGIVADSALNIADRIGESADDVAAALGRMCEDPAVLQMDIDRRVIRSPLAARMDPHAGSKTLRGWYKNWRHLPESEIKYHHITSLKEKIDLANDEQVRAWNETFGAEAGGRYALVGKTPSEPAQLRLIHSPEAPPPKQANGKHVPRQQEAAESAGPLPSRDSVEHMNAEGYIARFSADLMTSGIVGSMGATSEMFADAMHAMQKKAPGFKRSAEWDVTALNYVDAELFIRRLRNGNGNAHHTTTTNAARGTTHENNWGGRTGPRKATRAREPSDAPHDSAGQWSEVLHRKAAEPSVFPDT